MSFSYSRQNLAFIIIIIMMIIIIISFLRFSFYS